MLTVITPVAPDHTGLLHDAVASVEAQTMPVTHLVEVDADRHGPGVVRNRLLERVTTPFVTFLDADDWIYPTFAARLLAHATARQYAYCDWWAVSRDGAAGVTKAPDRCTHWREGTLNVITCVLPTAAVREVGGFNESLPYHEDAELFLKLQRAGVCGVRVPEPLFTYRQGGGRSRRMKPDDPVVQGVWRQYGGGMPCCGNDEKAPQPVDTSGDVRVQALWRGNRRVRGRASGRLYERTAYPKVLRADPRDVEAMPEMFRVVKYG